MKQEIKNKKSASRGFTLLEAVVAITVIGIIGFILAEILANTFKGSDKTKLTSKVVQNGQVALNKLSQDLRNADSIVCLGSLSITQNSTLVIVKGGQYKRFSFIPPTTGTNGYIREDSLSLMKLPSYIGDLCDIQDIQDVFTVSSSSPMTDSSPSGVSVTSGSFKKFVDPKIKDAITVVFQVGQSAQAGSGFQNQLGGSGVVDFQTTITLR